MIYKKSKYSTLIYGLCLSIICILAHPYNALARTPVIVEILGQSSCGPSVAVKDSLLKIMRDDPDVILLNCRMRGKDRDTKIETEPYYGMDICGEKFREYTEFLGEFGMIYPSVIVNGQLRAHNKNIIAAIRAARSVYDINRISISKENNILQISIPDLVSGDVYGEVFLSIYAPSLYGDDQGKINYDDDMDDKTIQNVLSNENVPIVKREKPYPDIIRPMLETINLGQWHGGSLVINYPLNEILHMYPNIEDLSYVVILRKGGQFAPVLAAGEVISVIEMQNTLPSNITSKTQLISMPY